jgi:hypothetical protein
MCRACACACGGGVPLYGAHAARAHDDHVGLARGGLVQDLLRCVIRGRGYGFVHYLSCRVSCVSCVSCRWSCRV